ncbi:MAG TPA: VPDSG-CTERM sorting domain-containing protein [Lacunisphaera sp.]|nr:VPDSG-CTERM sorting domain-containing protein [Lacunisphaera sp.]
MKNPACLLAKSALVVVMISTAARLHAGVLTFDDVVADIWNPTNYGDGFHNEVPNNSGVFQNNFGAWTNPLPSGNQVMTNYNSEVGAILRASAFDFVGAYFHKDIRYTPGPETVNFAGYDANGVLLYSTTLAISDSWAFIAFNWSGISKFTWDPTNPDTIENIGIDNFTYNESVADSGATVALLGLALAGLAGGRRRLNR